MERFDRYWEVLLSQLMLFRFAYPSDRALIPDWVMSELLGRTLDSMREGGGSRICRGNLLSRVNYAIDIREWGYADGRREHETERDREREGVDAAHAQAGLEDSVAAAGDLHCREDHHGRFDAGVDQLNAEADVLLPCGRSHRSAAWRQEGKTLAEGLSRLRIPCLAVFGNHDHEGGVADEIAAELESAGVRVLDGGHWTLDGTLGIAGVKGFAGASAMRRYRPSARGSPRPSCRARWTRRSSWRPRCANSGTWSTSW